MHTTRRKGASYLTVRETACQTPLSAHRKQARLAEWPTLLVSFSKKGMSPSAEHSTGQTFIVVPSANLTSIGSVPGRPARQLYSV